MNLSSWQQQTLVSEARYSAEEMKLDKNSELHEAKPKSWKPKTILLSRRQQVDSSFSC